MGRSRAEGCVVDNSLFYREKVTFRCSKGQGSSKQYLLSKRGRDQSSDPYFKSKVRSRREKNTLSEREEPGGGAY